MGEQSHSPERRLVSDLEHTKLKWGEGWSTTYIASMEQLEKVERCSAHEHGAVTRRIAKDSLECVYDPLPDELHGFIITQR